VEYARLACPTLDIKFKGTPYQGKGAKPPPYQNKFERCLHHQANEGMTQRIRDIKKA